MENKKKIGKTLVIIIAVVLVVGALLYILRGTLLNFIAPFNVTTFNSDIVVKRADGKEPLNMPYRYSKAILENRQLYEEEIVGLNISTIKYDLSDTGISLHNYEDILLNADSSEVKATIDSIKYCKGITALSGIISDKEGSKIELYEGCTADLLLKDYKHYAIIPSTFGKHINKELADKDKMFYLLNPDKNGLAYFTIIGEYEVKQDRKSNREPDTIYLSYAGLSNVVRGEQEDISAHIDCMEIDVNEQADLVKFSYFLSEYFADINVISQYAKRINRFNEVYSYMFVNTVGIEPIILEEDTDFEKTVITISRIDGKENLEMSHIYGDALINEYDQYLQYITDIILSTGRKGININDYPPYRAPRYGLNFGGTTHFFSDSLEYCEEQNRQFPYYHQAITGLREIKGMKEGTEITFYTNYTDKDLVKVREEDIKSMSHRNNVYVKGYAILPLTLHESTRNYRSIDYHVLFLSEDRMFREKPDELLYMGFKVIGYYELPEDFVPEEYKYRREDYEKQGKGIVSSLDKYGNEVKITDYEPDGYDTIYFTYAGYNDRYKLKQFKNEYIEAITIETKSDTDITQLVKYLERYFVPSDNTAKYSKEKNVLGLEYEYCYTITNKAN